MRGLPYPPSQLTIPLLLRKPCILFASVARVCQRQLAFLVEFYCVIYYNIRRGLRILILYKVAK